MAKAPALFRGTGRRMGLMGNSHPSLGYWIKNNENIDPKPGGAGWLRTALGFAIQRDNAGYYVRFASGFNQTPGIPSNGKEKYGI